MLITDLLHLYHIKSEYFLFTFAFFCIFDPKIGSIMAHFITEKEFVPANISHGSGWTNETEKGLYQIVYGVLQHYMTYEDIYDLVVRISKEQENEYVKRFLLQAWLDEVKSIIDRIRKLGVRDNNLIVYIPFTYYLDYLNSTLGRFEFVRFTIEEIQSKGDSQMEISSSPQYDYPALALDLLIEEYRNEVMGKLSDEEGDKCSYYNELIDDELIRRGHNLTEKYSFEYDSDTGMVSHTERKKLTELSPSKNYKHPEKFFDLNRFNDKHKMLKVEIEEDSDEHHSDNTPGGKTNAKEKTGILYYMLKELTQETNEKKWKKKAVAVINHVLGDDYEPDTARRYLANISKNIFDSKFCETVDETLRQYGFSVPQEIKKGLPPKKRS